MFDHTTPRQRVLLGADRDSVYASCISSSHEMDAQNCNNNYRRSADLSLGSNGHSAHFHLIKPFKPRIARMLVHLL